MFRKQTNCAKPGKCTSVVTVQEGIPSAKKPHPGQRVFVCHFVCSTQGRKFEGQGISKRQRNMQVSSKEKSLSGGCVFVHAASGHIKIGFQTFFSAQETTQTIPQHEQKARGKNRVIVQECQFNDGSSFTSKTLRKHQPEERQTSCFFFSGVRSHVIRIAEPRDAFEW